MAQQAGKLIYEQWEYVILQGLRFRERSASYFGWEHQGLWPCPI
jgi:hypothetical protein